MTQRFIGDWTIVRSIVDRDRMTEIACSGSARLRPDGDALAYDESVSFAIGGKPIRATRAYRFASAGGAIVATFDHGAPFFTLRVDGEGVGTAVHDCGGDRYTLRLTLRAPDTWETRWTVSGTKHLDIVTRYSR